LKTPLKSTWLRGICWRFTRQGRSSLGLHREVF
jgi:hypothetical protein